MGSVPTIYEDTRQQAGKHENIDRWFRNHGVEYEYRKLDAGDYATVKVTDATSATLLGQEVDA